VLLVEDEDSVRKLTRTILQTHGYQVIEARNGREGLNLAQQHQDKLDMVLSDMVMPQMGGRQLAEQLRLNMPTIKIMLMSGYTDDTALRDGLQAEEEVHFLQKPFSPRELLAKVREVMQATATW
jgi:CheY-like chemotaxis protein